MSTKLNLLPWRAELRLKKLHNFRLQLLVFLGAVLLILLSWHLLLQQQINLITKRTHYLQQQLDLVARQVEQQKHLNQQQLECQQIVDKLMNLKAQRTQITRFFKGLHQGVSNNLYFTKLQLTNHKVKMLGQAKTIVDLNHLVTNLAKINRGNRLEIQKIDRKQGFYGFDLTWLCQGEAD